MRWDITSKQSMTGIATWQVDDVNGLVDCTRKFRRAARDAHLRKISCLPLQTSLPDLWF